MRSFRSIDQIREHAIVSGVSDGDVGMILMKCGYSVRRFNDAMRTIRAQKDQVRQLDAATRIFGSRARAAVSMSSTGRITWLDRLLA